jgi:hypothetical protein
MKPARRDFAIEFIYTMYPGPHEVAWYKWEFVRRNPAYQADYQKFMRTFGTWFKRKGFWYDQQPWDKTWTKADEEAFYSKIAPVISQLCHKWKIGNLYSPRWRFNRKTGMRRVAGKEDMCPPTAISPEINWGFDLRGRLMEMGFTGNANSARRYRNLVLVEFDLNWPMKDLVRYAKYVLTRAVENYIDEQDQLGLKRRRSRRRFSDYDVHLKIWDLAQQNKSVPEITSLIFPHESRDASRQKVRDHLKAAKKLIEGGYAEIS